MPDLGRAISLRLAQAAELPLAVRSRSLAVARCRSRRTHQAPLLVVQNVVHGVGDNRPPRRSEQRQNRRAAEGAALVGRQLHGEQVAKVGANRPGIKVSDPATVHAIFSDKPYFVVMTARDGDLKVGEPVHGGAARLGRVLLAAVRGLVI
jgi:hypothetical protein